MSHKGDHSGFSEILLGREKSGGREGSEIEDDKSDHDGFAKITCNGGIMMEGNSMSCDGRDLTLSSALGLGI